MELAQRVDTLATVLPPEQQASFYELVQFPVDACANLNAIDITAGRNALAARLGDARANTYAEQTQKLFARDAEITAHYNHLLDGRWNHMADQTHIGYTAWNDPPVNVMPAVSWTQVPDAGSLGVFAEGATFNLRARSLSLGTVDSVTQETRTLDLFNRGRKPVSYTIKVSAPWLKASSLSGEVQAAQPVTLSVDWAQVPPAGDDARITVTSGNGADRVTNFSLHAAVLKDVRPNQASFIESDGYVAIEAAHVSAPLVANKAVGEPNATHWVELPGFGATHSAMTVYPVDAAPNLDSPAVLSYNVYLSEAGSFTLHLTLAPTNNFVPGRGLRAAVALDDNPRVVVDALEHNTQHDWEQAVSDGVKKVSVPLVVDKPGYHVLHLLCGRPGIHSGTVGACARGIASQLSRPTRKLPDRSAGSDQALGSGKGVSMKNKKQALFNVAYTALLLVPAIGARSQAGGAGASAQASPEKWVATWGASQQIPEQRNTLPAEDLTDATMRQIVHLSISGPRLRVRVSNAFGTAALHLASVHIARPVSPASSQIMPGTDRALSFGGAPDVVIPAGAEYYSEPVDYPVAPLSDLAITFYEEKPPAQETSHPGSRATTYYTHGNLAGAADLPGAKTIEHWYTIAGLDVAAPPSAFAIVALGDSITDGHAATTNGNDRWPDILARRLQGSQKSRVAAVVNVGTGGNRLLEDGLGPNALARFDRDVLARAGARYVMVLEGVNDLGTLHGLLPAGGRPPSAPAQSPAASSTTAPAKTAGTNARPQKVAGATAAPQQPAAFHMPDATAAQHEELVKAIIGSYQQMIDRAHAAGIRAIGTTILPFGGSGYGRRSPANEADRVKINSWILAPGHFDAVVDFAKIVADPQDPTRMATTFDSGDHLHPSPAGYRAMGESIPLSLFEEH